MGVPVTPIDERQFRPDPEGKRKFVLHDCPAAEIRTTPQPDLAPRQPATSMPSVSQRR
jgi:hypothetical protein